MAVVLFALPVLGDVTLGTVLAVGGIIAQFLLRPSPKPPTIKAMTSAWGNPIPLIYNNFRMAGQVLQAGDVQKHNAKSKKGGPTYSQTFAMGICEGISSIGRIWADNQCIYDPRPITTPPVWTALTDFAPGDQVQPTGNADWVLTATVAQPSGATEPSWNLDADASTRDGLQVWIAEKYVARTAVGAQYNFTMRVYPGDEVQEPDSALEEQVGAGLQVAYRGLCYVVFEEFDLSKYGNRIPNLEFEVNHFAADNFTSDAIYYGTAGIGSQIPQMPVLKDDSGNLYGVPISDAKHVTNIKTLATTILTNADIDADALSLGLTISGDWLFTPIAGKYLIAQTPYTAGGSGAGYAVVLYEINTDGSLTALGVRTYEALSSAWSQSLAATIRPDTQEIMIGFPDFTNLDVNMIVLDTIANMTGGYADRPASSRTVTVAEITGIYGAEPAPYGGYCMAFVGSDLYIFLNKAHMDWLSSHSSGVGYNSYYATLKPAQPNGVLLKISTLSDGAGALSYTFEGVSLDYGWPFSDEGFNKAGAPTSPSTPPYDSYGPPSQVQDPLSGIVSFVTFARTYSDEVDEVGTRIFTGQVQSGEQQGMAYGASANVDTPFIQNDNGTLYMAWSGPLGYSLLGIFTGGPLSLADICADISGRIGLLPGDYDYTGLTTVFPRGAAMLSRGTARSFLESMQPAFFFDITDIGERVVGTLRSDTQILLTIPEEDLAASEQFTTITDKISSQRNDDIEIPQDLSVSYYDLYNDYQQGVQASRRNNVTQYSSGRNTVSVPVVLTASEAANACERGLYLTWVERTPRKFNLPLQYIQLTPVDVVVVQRGGRNYPVRMTRATLQPTQVIDCESISEDLGVYHITVPPPLASQATGSFIPSTVKPIGQPNLVILDTAMLRVGDTAPGVYAAGAPLDPKKAWDGEFVQESPDNSTFSTVGQLTIEANIGRITNTVPTFTDFGVWDRTGTVVVNNLNDTLASASEDDLVQNFANVIWCGNGEILQYATATLNMDGSYTLSDLLRGRFGTEAFVGTHVAGEALVVLDPTTMQTIEYAASEIGATRYWQGLNDAPGISTSPLLTLVMTTRRLLPYAPYFLRGARDTPKNLTITGLRRMRWRGSPLWTPPETDTPVTMQVDILNGSTVVRTLTSSLSANGSGIIDASAFTAYYAVADQIIDFGSAQASVSIKAYQLNALAGRGYPGSKSV